MAPFARPHTSSYSSSIVTMAVSCTVFEIKRVIGRANFSYAPLVFNLHDPLERLRNFAHILTQTAQVPELAYQMVKKIAEKFNRLSRAHERYRRQTDDRRTARAIRRSPKNWKLATL